MGDYARAIEYFQKTSDGGDNNGKNANFGSGDWSWGGIDSNETNSSGEASLTFNVSMQPGDNFRVFTSLCKADLKEPKLTRAKMDSLQNLPKGVKYSDMLTVWRKLRVERDYMAPVASAGDEKNRVTGTADSYNYDPGTNRTTIDLGQNLPSHFDDVTSSPAATHQFVDGRYVVGGSPYDVISYSDPIGDDILVVADDCSSEPMDYILYDDDNQTMLDSPYYCAFDDYFDAFREAYIEPAYLPGSYSDEVSFNLNIGNLEVEWGWGDWDNEQDVVSSRDFWACTVVTCYQPSSDEDIDGEWDTTHGVTDDDRLPNTNVALMFVEEFRDYKNTMGSNKTEALIVAHEVGHTGGGDHGVGGHSYIMGDEEGQFSSGASSFHPETLKIFRSHRTWLQTN